MQHHYLFLGDMSFLEVEFSYNEDGSYFILLHPVVRSRCCFKNCQFNSNVLIGSRIATSFESHLFTIVYKPGIIAKQKWRLLHVESYYLGIEKYSTPANPIFLIYHLIPILQHHLLHTLVYQFMHTYPMYLN